MPSAKEEFAGVTAIEVKIAGDTVIEADAVIPPLLAVIVAVPAPVPLASPAAEIVATVVEDDPQVTEVVRF